MASKQGDEPDQGPRLYRDLADWYPLLTPVDDYVEEVAFYRRLFETHCGRPPRTLLDLGSGGGHNAAHLKATLACTLVDLAPAMLKQSRRLNPECEHVQGDMRSIRLGRVFDCVLVHDAVSYMGVARRPSERHRYGLRTHGAGWRCDVPARLRRRNLRAGHRDRRQRRGVARPALLGVALGPRVGPRDVPDRHGVPATGRERRRGGLPRPPRDGVVPQGHLAGADRRRRLRGFRGPVRPQLVQQHGHEVFLGSGQTLPIEHDMTEPTPRFWEVFFELYEGLPRQGPGNRACAEKALGLCRDLPPTPVVLDLGCGVGRQTLHLVELLRLRVLRGASASSYKAGGAA